MRKNRKKPFWLSSLGQMVQFNTIKFRINFVELFGQFLWIEKKSHDNSRVSLHEAPSEEKCERPAEHGLYEVQ